MYNYFIITSIQIRKKVNYLYTCKNTIFFLKTKFSIQLSLRQFFSDKNRIRIRGDLLKRLCASHHASTDISERSKTKNINWRTFVSSFSTVYRVSIPGGYPRRSFLLFQASGHGQFLHIAFVHDDVIDSGTLVNREPQTR